MEVYLFEPIENSIECVSMQFANKDCPKIESCDSAGIWLKLSNLINNFIYSVSLEDLISKNYEPCNRK